MELMRSQRVVLFSRTTQITRVYPITRVKVTSKVAFLFRLPSQIEAIRTFAVSETVRISLCAAGKDVCCEKKTTKADQGNHSSHYGESERWPA